MCPIHRPVDLRSEKRIMTWGLRAQSNQRQRQSKRERDKRHDERRREDQPWRPLYKTTEWARLRLRVFLRDAYTCQDKHCRRVTARPHADHITPHNGDRAMFFDEANVQTLCPSCHNAVKQGVESRGYDLRCDASGLPLDPDHPFNA